eukprot:3125716-Rhodomonas_salina.5
MELPTSRLEHLLEVALYIALVPARRKERHREHAVLDARRVVSIEFGLEAQTGETMLAFGVNVGRMRRLRALRELCLVLRDVRLLAALHLDCVGTRHRDCHELRAPELGQRHGHGRPLCAWCVGEHLVARDGRRMPLAGVVDELGALGGVRVRGPVALHPACV